MLKDNPLHDLTADNVLWQFLPLPGHEREKLLDIFAAGHIADDAEKYTLNQQTLAALAAHEGALQLRTLGNRHFITTQRFAAAIDFFQSKNQVIHQTAKDQGNALELMLGGASLLLTGGPGTGKSYLLREFIARKSTTPANRPLRITVTAPTGKAAARFQDISIKNAIFESATIHRLIGMGSSGKAQFHTARPLGVDILIVDEVSMLDLGLFLLLIEALPEHAQLILAGDLNQLPAIEGMPIDHALAFLESAGLLARGHLTQTYRFSAEKSALYAAIAQNGLNELPADAEHLRILRPQGLSGFFAYIDHYADEIFCGDLAKQLNAKLKRTTPDAPQAAGLIAETMQFLKKNVLLTHLREGMTGNLEINRRVGARLQRPAQGRIVFMPVIATKNDYRNGIFNGDMGFLWTVNNQQYCVFESGGTHRIIPGNQIASLETAYALTVHKSQGSEYENVIVVYEEKTKPADNRLLYTAVTRAKQSATIVIVSG